MLRRTVSKTQKTTTARLFTTDPSLAINLQIQLTNNTSISQPTEVHNQARPRAWMPAVQVLITQHFQSETKMILVLVETPAITKSVKLMMSNKRWVVKDMMNSWKVFAVVMVMKKYVQKAMVVVVEIRKMKMIKQQHVARANIVNIKWNQARLDISMDMDSWNQCNNSSTASWALWPNRQLERSWWFDLQAEMEMEVRGAHVCGKTLDADATGLESSSPPLPKMAADLELMRRRSNGSNSSDSINNNKNNNNSTSNKSSDQSTKKTKNHSNQPANKNQLVKPNNNNKRNRRARKFITASASTSSYGQSLSAAAAPTVVHHSSSMSKIHLSGSKAPSQSSQQQQLASVVGCQGGQKGFRGNKKK